MNWRSTVQIRSSGTIIAARLPPAGVYALTGSVGPVDQTNSERAALRNFRGVGPRRRPTSTNETQTPLPLTFSPRHRASLNGPNGQSPNNDRRRIQRPQIHATQSHRRRSKSRSHRTIPNRQHRTRHRKTTDQNHRPRSMAARSKKSAEMTILLMPETRDH